MYLLFFKTKREAITEWIIHFFEGIGVDPFVGVATIGTVAILLRIKSFLKERETKKKYSVHKIIEDTILVLATVSMILVIIYQE